jgi:hypothetical protein
LKVTLVGENAAVGSVVLESATVSEKLETGSFRAFNATNSTVAGVPTCACCGKYSFNCVATAEVAPPPPPGKSLPAITGLVLATAAIGSPMLTLNSERSSSGSSPSRRGAVTTRPVLMGRRPSLAFLFAFRKKPLENIDASYMRGFCGSALAREAGPNQKCFNVPLRQATTASINNITSETGVNPQICGLN